MDGLSLLDPLVFQPEGLSQHPAYEVGHALGWLSRSSKQASVNHMLSGRLYLSKSGWLLLSVPNALARGVFDALTAPGAELPTAGVLNVPNVKGDLFNAHISVMTADEVASIGADKINERGHVFHYGLGPIKEITPKNIDGVSKIWAVQVASPALAALRKSYGLSPLLNGDHQFHITVAVRRKKVLQNNDISKFDAAAGRGELKAAAQRFSAAKLAKDLLAGGDADNKPDRSFSAAALAQGKTHEREHTNNGQIAKEIAKDHLSEDPRYYEKVEQIEKAAQDPIDFDKWHGKAFKIVTTPPGMSVKSHTDGTPIADEPGRVSIVTPENGASWNWPSAPQETINNFRTNWQSIQGGIGGYKMDQIRRGMQQPAQTTGTPTPQPAFQPVPNTTTGVIKSSTATKKEKVGNAYVDQLAATPINYDKQKSIWQNVLHHATAVKQRGDQQIAFRNSDERMREYLDPQYRTQKFLQSIYAKPKKDRRSWRKRVDDGLETVIHNYGHKLLNKAIDHTTFHD